MNNQSKPADAVFEGGGVKGIALVGALRAFEDEGFHWKNVSGTSAGAITAGLVAAGFTASEVKDIMKTRVVFSKFMDTSGMGKLPVIGPVWSLVKNEGLYKGDYFVNLMRELLKEKTGKDRVTFGDLKAEKVPGDSDEEYENKYKYRLTVIASDISANEMLVLPYDIKKLGLEPDDLEVALALRMSMSIPYFFRPVIVSEPGNSDREHWIVDGGILSNFPINLFDSATGVEPQWPTFGFLLWEPGSGKPGYDRIGGLITMTKSLVETLASAHNRRDVEEANQERLIKIPTGKFTATDFDLSDEDWNWLYDSGYNAAKEFLNTWSWQGYRDARKQRDDLKLASGRA